MGFDRLVEIMARLRDQCPWDVKQTHESLRPYLIEEAYEFLEALERGNDAEMCEELGDLLLQIVFHARIAEQRGAFNIHQVAEGISDKMVRRHPHVFGDAHFETPEEVVGQWELRKKEEGKLRQSILEGVPQSMPALLRAHRIQSRAAKSGFDWERIEDTLDKVEEELAEFREALRQRDQQKVDEELGDVLFSLVNVSRFCGTNPEDALRSTIAKFIRRFRKIEMYAAENETALKDMTLQEMDDIWNQSKRDENKTE